MEQMIIYRKATYRRSSSETPNPKDKNLLNQRSSALTQRIPNHIHGCLPLRLRLLIQRNVRHLLTRIEQRVLRALAQNILRRTHEDREHERRRPERRGHRLEERSEDGQRVKRQSRNPDHRRRDHRRIAPSELAEDLASEEHHYEGDGSGGRGEVAHERRVRVGIGVRRLEFALPRYLDEVDAHSVADDEHGEVADVGRAEEEFGRFAQAHLDLLLLLFGRLFFLVDTLGIGHDLALHVVEEGNEACSGDGDGSHEVFDGHSPGVDARWEVGAEGGDEANVLAGKDERYVSSQSKQWIILLRLIHGRNLIRKTPKQQTRHDAPPHLGHDVKEGEAPIPHDRQRGAESLRQRQGDLVHEGVRMEGADVRKDDEGERDEEEEEGDGARVEYVLLFHAIAEFAVECGETDGCREIDICFNKGNNFRTRSLGSNHQYILGIAKDGVIEQNEEKHQGQWY